MLHAVDPAEYNMPHKISGLRLMKYFTKSDQKTGDLVRGSGVNARAPTVRVGSRDPYVGAGAT